MGSITRRALLQATSLAAIGARIGRASAAPGVVRRLGPLSVRGVNYYPAQTPWGGMWTKTPADVWERDMAQAAALNANCVRTFVPFGAAQRAAGLITAEGAITETYHARIEGFLAAAGRHGVRAILCLEGGDTLEQPAVYQRWLREMITPYRNDGRVLLWDLMNEPESDAKWTPTTRAYLAHALAALKEADPSHPTTVGLTWRIDRLAQVGLPDVLQYHEYAPKAALQAEGAGRIRKSIAGMRKVGGERPLLIGEFGMSTARDPAHGAGPEWEAKLGTAPGTEAEQRWLYGLVLQAAEEEHIAGVLPWCLHSYRTQQSGFLTPVESMMGLVRHDGTLKPAAELLRDTYARWAKRPDAAEPARR